METATWLWTRATSGDKWNAVSLRSWHQPTRIGICALRMNCCPRSLSIRLRPSGRIRTIFSKKRMPMSDDLQALQSFSGIARLFPLPNAVLFPHLVMPLHIFEPRYRQMTRDALAGDRFIAMVLLQPGWESEYEALPAIHSVACLGRIQAEQRLPDGRFNIQLRG